MGVHLPQIGRIAKEANANAMKCHVQNYPTIQKSPPSDRERGLAK